MLLARTIRGKRLIFVTKVHREQRHEVQKWSLKKKKKHEGIEDYNETSVHYMYFTPFTAFSIRHKFDSSTVQV